MRAPRILHCLILFYIIGGVHSAFQLPHDTVQCLDQTVEYQCTVSGSILRWRLLDENQTPIETILYTSDEVGSIVQLDNDRFTFGQLSPASPIVSNVSFTVQSSIDGYTIRCIDTATSDSVDITIDIAGNMGRRSGISNVSRLLYQ